MYACYLFLYPPRRGALWRAEADPSELLPCGGFQILWRLPGKQLGRGLLGNRVGSAGFGYVLWLLLLPLFLPDRLLLEGRRL